MEVPRAAGLLPFDYAVTSLPVELFRIPVALLAGSVNITDWAGMVSLV